MADVTNEVCLLSYCAWVAVVSDAYQCLRQYFDKVKVPTIVCVLYTHKPKSEGIFFGDESIRI